MIQTAFIGPPASLIGFLEASIPAVLDAQDRDWMRVYKSHVSSRQESETLASLLSSKHFDYLLVECDGGWTAHFHTVRDVAWGPMVNVAHVGGFRAVNIEIVAGSIHAFRVEDPPARSPRRLVMVHNDGGRWGFHQDGEPFPFEEVDQYSITRVRDRLTTDMIGRYCEALGIRPFDPTFYSGERIVYGHEPIGSQFKRMLLRRP